MKSKKINEGKKKKQARKSGVPVHLAHRCSQSARRWLRPYNKIRQEHEFRQWKLKDLKRAGFEECGSEPKDERE